VARAVIFDVGNVLYDWDPRYLYAPVFAERGLSDAALDTFLTRICTKDWHYQFDRGVPFAEGAAALTAEHPDHADLIALWGPRFVDQVGGLLPGMAALVDELAAADVPLYAITNFSAEFWPPFRAREAAIFDHFRDIVVSGKERLVKPNPAIYRLGLDRFGLPAGDAVFIDDREENVAAAKAVGLHALLFTDANALRRDLAMIGLLAS